MLKPLIKNAQAYLGGISYGDRKRITIGILIFLGLCLAVFWNLHHPNSKHNRHKRHAIAVKTAVVSTGSMPIIFKASGTVEAEKSVDITPQVTGTIKQVLFQEGQDVAAGQLLFIIDQTSYRAALNEALATLAKDSTQLTLAKTNEKRFAALVKPGYVSRQEYEQAVATAQSAQAVVDGDQAQVQQAQTQLNHTEIHSPFAGRTGNVSVKIGNLVVANSTTPLVTINRLDNMRVSFSLPQSQLPELLHYQKISSNLAVEISVEDSQKTLATGNLEFIDNKVNTDTASVLLKAKIPNPNLAIWPGELVNIKIILAVQPNVLIVPSSAVQLDQQGAFVYLVHGKKVSIRRVTVGRYLNEVAVIKQGLQKGETVVSVVTPGLADGSTITIDSAVPTNKVSADPADLSRWGSPEGENRDFPPLVQAKAPLLRSIQTRKQFLLYSAGTAVEDMS